MPVMNGWDFLEEFETLKNSLPSMPKNILFYPLQSIPKIIKEQDRFLLLPVFISKPLTRDLLDRIKVIFFFGMAVFLYSKAFSISH